jgi:hypothetical protein
LEQHFPLPLLLTWLGPDPLTGTVMVQLDGPFQYVLRETGERYELTVPVGFVCDGASIPGIAWSLVGHPFGPVLPAAVLHDYLYSELNQTYDRRQADRLFRNVLRLLPEVSRMESEIMYRAVRWFGATHYRGGVECT